MLLNDFKKVSEIDDEIQTLHAQLADLYNKRNEMFGSTEAGQSTQNHTNSIDYEDVNQDKEWVDSQYSFLEEAWKTHGIKIPAKKTLNKKLINAKQVIDSLDYDLGEKDLFKLLLVPSSNKLPFPLDKTGNTALENNYMDSGLHKPKKVRNWKLFVVYAQPEGANINNIGELLLDGHMDVCGYKMPGLDLREYSALILQNQDIRFDENSWSLMVKDLALDEGYIPCVSCFGGSYNFNVDDPKSLLGENRFRPAMEVK